MHEFRFLAPIRVGFTTLPGALDRDAERCQSLWEQIETDIARRKGWTLHRTSRRTPVLGWSRSSGDVLRRPLEVASAQVPVESIPAVGTRLEVDELGWTLYDHNVLLVHGVLRTTEHVSTDEFDDVDLWEAEVQRVGEQLARRCVDTDITHLLQRIRRIPEASDLVRIEELPTSQPLWVTRALVHDPQRGDEGFARRWVARIDAEHQRMIEQLLDGERPFVAQWLNHVHLSTETEAVSWHWHALRIAQFLWAAMHYIDDELRQILAWSMADLHTVSVSDLRRELRAMVNQAQDLLMLRAEVFQHLSRSSLAEVQRVLNVWGYTQLLEDPVRAKLSICGDRLTALAEDRAARSAMFTDIILMSIGVTSVLATAIALVQFGRDAGQDPSQSVFDLGGGSITSWLSSQSMDAILILSLLASVILVVIFIWKRRQSIS
ncbi:hypothetical protein [Brachybacterium sp. Marseille-Q7125]|uniref:hypothetical protein n=1 Tax=Brachybacterium sp. Marseille-Q7125 TaxID=2932815 RepID=UPI001FF2E507|nr:hypothetical protein [Brachybacterium sp. Marseille-Q7125]